MNKKFEVFAAVVYSTLGRGPKQAKSRKRLCEELKCNDRALRKAIEYLRIDFPILSRDDGKGYYLADITNEGKNDAARWVKRQNKRVKSIKMSTSGARKFCHDTHRKKQIPGQISMFGGE